MSDNKGSTTQGRNSTGVEGRDDVSETFFEACLSSLLNVYKGKVDEAGNSRGSLNSGVSFGASSVWGDRFCFQTADSTCQPDWVVRFCIEHPGFTNNRRAKGPSIGHLLQPMKVIGLSWKRCLKGIRRGHFKSGQGRLNGRNGTSRANIKARLVLSLFLADMGLATCALCPQKVLW